LLLTDPLVQVTWERKNILEVHWSGKALRWKNVSRHSALSLCSARSDFMLVTEI